MEILDVVDEEGNPTGETVERKRAHREGIRHRSSHVWLLRKRKGKVQLLLQKRSNNKDSFPGCYDISSAGHIPAGMDYVASALRELKEELGMEAKASQLHYCGKRYIYYDRVFYGERFVDNQVSNIYVLWMDREEREFTLQEEEVEAVKWLDLEECMEAVRENRIPHCIMMEELDMVKNGVRETMNRVHADDRIIDLMKAVNGWIEDILQDKYVGVYFHGSLRLGSFNYHKSDLDFIIVVNHKISNGMKRQMCDKMMENRRLFPKKGFEFSVVLEKYCHEFIYPTPFELHMSEAFEKAYLENPENVIEYEVKVDPDLASHFHVINVPNDVMDFGRPSKEVFSVVPEEYVLKSNWSDIKDAEQDITNNPTYTILNLCRFYAYIRENLTLSKYDGGRWALENMNSSFPNIIKKAMEDYMSEDETAYNTRELYDFAHETMDMIRKSMNTLSP